MTLSNEAGNRPAQTLQAWLDARPAPPDWPTTRSLLVSLLDALEVFHATFGAHGGIAPDTLAVADKGAGPRIEIVVPGASKDAVDDETAALFRAPEASFGDEPERSSDLYGIAAVAMLLATGRIPEKLAGRQRPSAVALAMAEYPAAFLKFIDAATIAEPHARPDLAEWRSVLLVPARVGVAAATRGPGLSSPLPAGSARRPRARATHAAPLMVGAAFMALAGAWLLKPPPSELQATGTVTTATAKAAAAEPFRVAALQPRSVETATEVAVAAPPAFPKAVLGGPAGGSGLPTGATLRDCATCPEMVVIQPDIAGAPRGFAVGRSALTREAFRNFRDTTGYSPPPGCQVKGAEPRLDMRWSWEQPGFAQADRDPAVCLSFSDAKAFIGWLSERTGQRYRLLTDAEWDRLERTSFEGAVVASGDSGTTGPSGTLSVWVDSCPPGYSGAVSGHCADATPRTVRADAFGVERAKLAAVSRMTMAPHLRHLAVGVRIARDLGPCEASGEGCPVAGRPAGGGVRVADAGGQAAPSTGTAGVVDTLNGKVVAIASGQDRALAAKGPVYVGDVVRTDQGSRATLKLGARTTLRLGERTEIKLERYVVDAGGVIELKGGAIQFERTGRPADTSLTFRSEYGMIAVRGTRFFAGPSRGAFGVLVGSGRVEVTSGGQTVVVGPQMGTDIAKPGAPPSQPKQWGYERVREALGLVR